MASRLRPDPSLSGAWLAGQLSQREAERDPGVLGNARLTGTTGVVLLVMLAIEGVTILRIRPLLSWHFFFGFLLIPPVLLKMASTGYRFVHYYGGDARYRAAGPPRAILRLVAPVVVVSTVVVFVTGVELWVYGDQFGPEWLRLHQLSFVVWFFATSIHVLGHLARAPKLAFADFQPGRRLGGSMTRRSLAAGSVITGLALALATAQHVSPFVSSHFLR